MWPEYETDIIEGKYIFRCDPEYSIKAIKNCGHLRASVKYFAEAESVELTLRPKDFRTLSLSRDPKRPRGYTSHVPWWFPKMTLERKLCLSSKTKSSRPESKLTVTSRNLQFLPGPVFLGEPLLGAQVAYERNLNTHKSEWSWRLTLAQYIEDGGYYSKRKSALNDYMDCSCKWYASVVNPEFSGKKSENQQEVVADVGQGKLEVREVGLVLNLDGRRP
mmetsp:Transcript_10513/g.38690  ORF Transcript_10513/g.38690 Transcript_10513/m.38690 type:complete len:219 (-) Transcript_10513:91-747(-)